MKGAVAWGVLLWMTIAWETLAAATQSAPSGPASEEQAKSPVLEKRVEPTGPVKGADQPPGKDLLSMAIKMNSEDHPLPEPDFSPGHVKKLEFDSELIKKTQSGFTIQMPSETAVATPAVQNGRLYVSGGFSCEEFYCFDAKNGELIWGVELDDDGASAPVVDGDAIIFNTESCTIFALDAADGKLRWAHWLGDPLMSVPTVSGGRVFTTYPVENTDSISESQAPTDEPQQVGVGETEEEGDASERDDEPAAPSHVLICFDVNNGNVLWQRWIDTECMSAPVVVDNRLLVTTLSGTLYEFNPADGQLLAARQLRATSAPVVVGRYLYFTRRTDSTEKEEMVSEAIIRLDRNSGLEDYITCLRPAPYLDWQIQIEAQSTVEASEMEEKNSIMGGFGGGMFSLPPENLDNGEAVKEPESPLPPVESEEPMDKPTLGMIGDQYGSPQAEDGSGLSGMMDEPAKDLLAITERLAADVIGQGNVAMLQSYHGSRVLPLGGRIVACMGDLVVCVSAETGKLLWSVPLEGNIEKLGGYLASPPVAAGGQVFLSTLAGNVIQLDVRNGRKTGSYDIGSPMRYPPIVVEGRIYATTQSGQVVCVFTGDRTLTGWSQWYCDPAHTNVAVQQ